ncbi:Cwf15/Cwc15 cell cycle control protein [Ascodesmis nigricans]|uniref:Cwf15/Cwc15 cell cycle control protein n=1 Tax=Ascodesmis nigricans TaxID=341454 RepID=A0A4S2N2B1_9PEZI|nr:Cwf15/Cwc15 cell cycle control protein [Ascodesmis nigricans]
MTTAHRPTFDPARGKELPKGPAYHQRLLPAHTTLKVRQPGQGGDGDSYKELRDLRAELLAAEAAARAKREGRAVTPTKNDEEKGGRKRRIEGDMEIDDEEEDLEAKRRRILEETRYMDADDDDEDDDDEDEEGKKSKSKSKSPGAGADDDDDDDDSESDSSDDDDDDDEDETALLLRELEKIKRERAEAAAKEAAEKEAAEQEKREYDIARGNPLLNPKDPADFNVKRRWDDDVIFKNQARGTEDKGKRKEFVNDLLRSEFHKKFMSKYVR